MKSIVLKRPYLQDIYVFPQISNLECPVVPNKIIYSTDGDKLSANLEAGSNYKLFKYINLVKIIFDFCNNNFKKIYLHIILLIYYLIFELTSCLYR